MTDDSASISPTLRARVSSGYDRLDSALERGFFAGTAIVISAPVCNEVPILLANFLKAARNDEDTLLICRSLSSAQALSQVGVDNPKVMVCGEAVSPARNILPGKSIENLTELNLQITDTLKTVQPKRVALDILSDVLLRHKALQTRKWLSELLSRLRSKDITVLAVINPYMHTDEEVQAVLDLFDGNIEIIEKDIEGSPKKLIRIRWMHGIEVAESEFPLAGLNSQQRVSTPAEQSVAGPVGFNETRWLTPLVNRTDEISKLKRAFEDALIGKPSVVALQGEAGAGKTRLARELTKHAQSSGALVLTGRPPEESLPYAPWVELAREYVSQTPGELLRRMLGPNVSEFGRLVPDIAAKLGTIPPSKPLEGQQDRIRLYEAITQFLISISREAPLLILLDDMQWADTPSLDLLEYFVRGASNHKVLCVCCYRSENVEAIGPLERTLMKLNRDRLLETIPVRNLNKEDTSNLMAQIFGERQVSGEFADLVYQRTDGNPFFVEEVLRSLIEDGTIFQTEKGWDRKPIRAITVPKTVSATLRSRLTRVEQETLGILTWASVAGSEFNFDVLHQLSQLDEDTLLKRLEMALSSGLLVEVAGQKGVFRFADNRIRELLLDDLSQIRKSKYHLKIAEAIEKLYPTSRDRYAGLLAYHFSEGGDIERGIRYSVMAGDRSQSIHAYDQAVNDYRRALDLIDLQGGGVQDKVAVLEKLGAAYHHAGKHQESIQSYERALAISEGVHDNKACARACLGLANAILEVKGWGKETRTGAEILKRGLKYLEGEADSFEAASIYATFTWYYGLVDEYDEANAWAEKALKAGEATKNFRAVAAALSTQASFLTDTGRIDEGLALWQRAVDMALQHEEYQEGSVDLLNLSVYTYPRDLAKARELVARMLEIAKRVGDIMGETRALGTLSKLDWLRGEWALSEKELQNGLANRERVELRTLWLHPGWIGRLLLSTGDLQGAEAEFQKALDSVKETAKLTEVVLTHLGLGLLRLEQEKYDEAQSHFEASANAFKKWEFSTDPILHIETLLHLTAVYSKHGELEKAHESSQWAKRLAETLRSDAGLAMASQAEASLLFANGDKEAAQGAYLKSIELWQKAGWPYYHAKGLVAYAETISETSPNESHKCLEQAAEIFKKLGAKRDLEKAQGKLSRQA